VSSSSGVKKGEKKVGGLKRTASMAEETLSLEDANNKQQSSSSGSSTPVSASRTAKS
jgi:hypothetical protein